MAWYISIYRACYAKIYKIRVVAHVLMGRRINVDGKCSKCFSNGTRWTSFLVWNTAAAITPNFEGPNFRNTPAWTAKSSRHFWNRSRPLLPSTKKPSNLSNNIGCYVSIELSCSIRNFMEGFRGFSPASDLTSFTKRIIRRESVFTPTLPDVNLLL